MPCPRTILRRQGQTSTVASVLQGQPMGQNLETWMASDSCTSGAVNSYTSGAASGAQKCRLLRDMCTWVQVGAHPAKPQGASLWLPDLILHQMGSYKAYCSKGADTVPLAPHCKDWFLPERVGRKTPGETQHWVIFSSTCLLAFFKKRNE
jgi:hypothetical protein